MLQKYASLPSDRKQFLINALPFAVIVLYILFSVFSPTSDFERAKQFVLKNPKDAHAHILLSQIFKKNNDLDRASEEALIANSLNLYSKEIKDEMISLNQLKAKRGLLQKELNYWESISNQKTNYRDAFLQKAELMYQLKNISAAKVDLQKAIELDPNNEMIIKMQRFLDK